ncbi:rhodanese-like domain-containing protein [Komarekiella sp. 'clone 1']|uniref:Rhodanese-like domain-containing protein n=1 Tax=Komarekiella delphini-convector SJRDD-AB1 TaxID=2593771 RepID=A0AA40T4E5_9NOST|nr:rhodanese-like domain-containing protein [Komarekiella delphini-convector SJRDD-AB1]
MRSLTFNLLKFFIGLIFPGVHQIKTKEFAQWLLDSAPQPLILDARNQAEYEVSHLKAAIHIDPIAPDLAALSKVAKDTPIVVYCSIGYRSAKLVQQLDEAGFSGVFNLSGGIFQWANEGKPIFKHDQHPTHFVHPYNPMWGKLLRASYHAQEHQS